MNITAEPDPQTDSVEYITLRQLKERFQISRSRAYEMAKAGDLDMRKTTTTGKTNGKMLVSIASVRAFLSRSPQIGAPNHNQPPPK